MRCCILLALLLVTLNIRAEEIPKRIISLSPRITKSLYLLGVDERIVANTVYCVTPDEARKKEKIGTVVRMDIEKTISLSPDIVLATSLSNPEQVKRLRDLGIKVVQFPSPRSLDELLGEFLALGRIVGREEEAGRIIRDVLVGLDVIKGEVMGLPRRKVVVQVGTRPLYISPKASFVNEIIELSGGINVGPDGDDGRVGYEEVVKQNPEVIIIATMGFVGEEEKRVWKRYPSIEAVRGERIYIIDSERLCSLTPPDFLEAVKTLKDLLHPEL
jgi:iron complex transport system substrate-binding protein